MKKSLLIVDDEENIRSSLKRLFRRENITILTANSGSEGLKLLKENDIDVILSDQLMPKMTGVEFLSKAREVRPDTLRIVLSGYSDFKSITDSINEGAIWRFISKPWDDDLLLKTIDEAFKHRFLEQENTNLADELEKANKQLKDQNENLERMVEEKTRSLVINMRALQISQDVLSQLPSAVIGIDDNGSIAIANDVANKIISNSNQSILGSNINDLLPDIFSNTNMSEIESLQLNDIVLDNDSQFDVSISRLKPPAQANGLILVFTQKPK